MSEDKFESTKEALSLAVLLLDQDVTPTEDTAEILASIAPSSEGQVAAAGIVGGIGGVITQRLIAQAVEMAVGMLQDPAVRQKIKDEVGSQLDKLLDYLASKLGADSALVQMLRSCR